MRRIDEPGSGSKKEKAAGEAQVKIVFPGIMIMIACLLIIVTPFIVKFLDIFF